MLAHLKEQFDRLEASRQTLVRKLLRLDAGKLTRKPGSGRWSILEDCQHLVLAEQRTVLEFGSIPVSEKPNPDNLALVLHVLDQDVPVEVPDPDMVPDGHARIDDLIRDWEQARQRFQRFLEIVGEGDLDTPVTRHPVTGPLSVAASLQLLASHFHHHRRRIEAAIEGGD